MCPCPAPAEDAGGLPHLQLHLAVDLCEHGTAWFSEGMLLPGEL